MIPATSPLLALFFQNASAEFEVPAELLEALCWEATRCDPEAASQWGGYGLYDLREDDEEHGPGVELAAQLLELSPDEIMASPEQQVRAAAALLAWYAPDAQVDDLESWAPALQAFSRQQDPGLQLMYLDYVYGVVGVTPDWDRVYDELPAMPAPAGDYSGNSQYVQAHSSNYTNSSRSPSQIKYVVIHTVQGSYSGCISWFQNSSSNVSAHYVVRSSDGAVTQMVMEEDIAWHAGNWSYNEQSVGIEHEGYVDNASWYTEAMYKGSAKLTADIVARNAVTADRNHIIAHSEVPGATHTDPGSNWDWSYYMDLVGGGGGTISNAELLGVVADTDIYNGERLVGVTVTLDQTGETVKTDGDGYYSFDGLSAGSWSVTVTADGYEDGTCAKDIENATGQWWCSVAMTPSEDEPEPEETGDPSVDDTGEPQVHDGGPPGGREKLRGCATASGGGLLLGLLGLLGLRRR